MTLAEALAEVHRRNCLPGRHDDACTAFTAGVDDLIAERDRARRVAVALEQENARLWQLATCPLCGNGADADDRDDFLAYGAHGGCMADQQRDAELDFMGA